jgi:hypothetical protein
MRDDPDFADLAGLLRFDEPVPKQSSVSDARLLTILRVGKLTIGRFEELCLIRQVGAGGVMAHVHAPLAARQRVQIELGRDRAFWGTVLWVKDKTAGIGFDADVELEGLLARSTVAGEDYRSAGPRLNMDCEATLRVGGRFYKVRVHDLGQSGAGVSFLGTLEDGQDVVLTLQGFQPIQGVAVWCRKGRAGIAFHRPIGLEPLTRWLHDRFGTPRVERQGAGVRK